MATTPDLEMQTVASESSALPLLPRRGPKGSSKSRAKGRTQGSSSTDNALIAAAAAEGVQLVAPVTEPMLDAEKEIVEERLSLYHAAAYGFEEQVAKKIKEAGPEKEAFVRTVDENGHTALHYASRNGRVEVMQMLIEAGAEVNTAGTSATLMFPIHWACSTGMVKAVHLLLSHDAALEQTDSNGATPLIMACQNGHAGLAIYLIKRGADVNKRDKEGDTALSWAAYHGLVELITLLVALGSDPQIEDSFGMRPVHLAAFKGHRPAVEALVLEFGVRIDLKDKKNRLPIEIALEQKHRSTAQFLASRAGSRSVVQVAKTWFLGEGRHLEGDKRAVIFFAACILLSYLMYMYLLLPALPGRPFLHASFVLVNSFMWFSWLSCCHSDPGILSHRQPLKKLYTDTIESMVKTGDIHGDLTLCHSCQIVRPLRSKHCKVTRQCVARFDHYCPFVLNAVGDGNRRYFFGTIFWTTVANGMMVYMHIVVGLSLHGFSAAIVLGILFSLFFSCIVGVFTCWHAYLIARNMTTNEVMTVQRSTYMLIKGDKGVWTPFSRGMVRNCVQFFLEGDAPLYNRFQDLRESRRSRT